MNKKIGITLRIENIEKYNEKRDAISHDWVKFLKSSNSIPILIPNNLNNVRQFLDELKLDGFILSGGDNKGDNIERDYTEKEIIEFSIEKKIPMFGVCRGMQVINDFFGGELNTVKDSSHVAKRHNILLTDTNFQKLLQSDKIEVNSFHNNIIKKESLGNNLQDFAISEKDNTVEGFFHKDLPIIGVMWHPEREKNFQNDLKLFNKVFGEKVE